MPVGVVVMVLGSGWMLDGLLAALKRWEQDHYTLLKMQRALAELEALSYRNGRRRLITDSTLLPTPIATESGPMSKEVSMPAAIAADAGSSKKEREESKRVTEVAGGTTSQTKRHFFGLRRRLKSIDGKSKSERAVITSFDDQQLPSSAEAPITPTSRPRTASVDSAPDFNSRASTPDSSASLSPSLSPNSGQLRLPNALHLSSSWPVSLADTRTGGEAGDQVEGMEAIDVIRAELMSVHSLPLPPRLVTRVLQMCPSLATVRSYLLTTQAMLPLFVDIARLLSLYFRMAARHLASRAPDSLEVAHRVIAGRAMKDHSVTDSDKTVKKRSTHREALRQRKKQLAAAAAAAAAASRHSGSTQHSALAQQLTQVYQSINRARGHAAGVPAITVTSPQAVGGAGSAVPPLARGVPSAVAARMTGGGGGGAGVRVSFWWRASIIVRSARVARVVVHSGKVIARVAM